ncbi:hypothetical protein PVAND_004959 [Polypedilum vanderplanki]|uniref:Uncharacterized protein n=1 Tax=Polypedilum vanderplanki TaxID=319348 RepID=A0A9J6BZM7_POLVA|nr:hypothetical protein PVAND_004959 [Polypedilum vanderplanki]
MKFLTITIVLACAFISLAENNDGKYRPEAVTTQTTTTPTTIRPANRWNDPRWGWNTGINTNWNNPAARNDWRWRNTNQWDPRYNVDAAGRPINRFNDWRTIHLDEVADARGYQYDYETVGGIKVLETGTFENVGLRHEGVRAVGSIVITDRDGVIYKINYQSESKDAYIPRGAREPERIPPTLAKALALLESHK